MQGKREREGHRAKSVKCCKSKCETEELREALSKSGHVHEQPGVDKMHQCHMSDFTKCFGI